MKDCMYRDVGLFYQLHKSFPAHSYCKSPVNEMLQIVCAVNGTL